jgi:hypothetical protein
MYLGHGRSKWNLVVRPLFTTMVGVSRIDF